MRRINLHNLLLEIQCLENSHLVELPLLASVQRAAKSVDFISQFSSNTGTPPQVYCQQAFGIAQGHAPHRRSVMFVEQLCL